MKLINRYINLLLVNLLLSVDSKSILKNHLGALGLFCIISLSIGAQAPVANFTGNPLAGCSPLVINFQDLSSNNPTSWLWDFGNGSTSTVKNPTATYFNPGTYTVKLTATNANGSNTLNRTGYITVYVSPSVNFKADDTVGCFPHSVQFTDLSTAGSGNTNTAWEWNFGDGSISTTQNPQHTYTSSGNFTVTLKVTNDKGCSKIFNKPQYVKVSPGVVTDFTNTTPAICSPPVPVNFTSTSTGPGNLSYNWNFGDGGTSASQNPVYFYNSSGSFSVTLTVNSSLGCSASVTKSNLIVISTNNTSFLVPDSACVNDTISFTNTTSPQAATQTWNFGDGTTSSQLNPVKAYSNPGTYQVVLNNTYATCTDTAIRTIVISPRPAADFMSADTIHCKPPHPVNFQNVSSGSSAWFWDFGDGTSSTLQNPSHTYTNYGNYTVTLIATNAAGCTDTIIKQDFIKINKPVITITGLPEEGCVPFTVNPVPMVTTLDAVTAYLWEFGDGTTSAVQNPSHTYLAQGSYTIRLIITTSLGCQDTLTLVNGVKAGTLPVADFSANPLSTCAFSDVQFTDLSAPADQWIWDFGDGTTSGAKNPVHQFNTPGTFPIKLTAVNSGCPNTITKPAYITVLPPVSKFNITPDCSNRTRFTFTDNSLGPVSSWLWDFGDGTTSTAQNPPAHIFPGLGTYTVSLTVTNGSCVHSVSKTIKAIDENPDFAANTTTICRATSIDFTVNNLDTTNISLYIWYFGDGIQKNSSVTTTSHIYQNAGSYTVTLVTKDLNGCYDTIIKPNYIRTNGPVVDFSATNAGGCSGLTTTFNDLSIPDGTNPIVTWEWNFGDGTIQPFTAPPFTHTYASTGTFSVSLKITDAAGCVDTITKNNLIHSTDPFITFSTLSTQTCPGANVGWGILGLGTGLTYLWDFGDGTTSTQTFPVKSYPNPGLYTVKLFATDIYGCTDSLVRTNYIRVDLPLADFVMNDSVSSCAPFEVNFTNTSTYFKSQLWTFEPGVTSTLQNPAHYFSVPGVYNVELIVTSPGGCKDTTYKSVRLYDTSGSRIDYNPFTGCNPITVNFNAVATAIPTFIWDFGDGQSAVTNSPTISHTYTEFGDFAPKVIFQDPTGCLIPITGLDTIHSVGATANFGVNPSFLCDEGLISFTDSTTFNDPVVSYSWNFGDGSSATVQQPSHYYSGAGYYNAWLAVQTQSGCTDTIRIDSVLKIVARPDIFIDGDPAACMLTQLQFSGNFNTPDTSLVTWNWTFGNGSTGSGQNPLSQTYSASGDYTVTAVAENSSGCKDTAQFGVRIHPLPSVNMPPDIITVAGTTITIPASYSGTMSSYLWTPSKFLSCSDCPRPDVTPDYNVQYTVSFTDSNGCENTGNILVKALCKNANVFIPNTFSPNGDGSNEVFFPRGTGLDRVKIMRIFNRWGEVVFERYDFPVNNSTYGWDGKWKGKNANAGVYIYQIEIYCQNGELLTYQGNIALIR